jgi:bifunctional non-homologous end joining protein LigD
VAAKEAITLEVAGRQVRVSSPSKVYWPEPGITKRELVEYYLAVADGALNGAADRPLVLKRFVHGITKPPFFQKRAPKSRPPWIDTVDLHFPSGRSATEVVLRDAASLVWAVNLGCLDLNPHAIRDDDLAHPDELRIDLDPVPGVPWSQIREVALVVREVLTAHGLVGWPKTSGSRGMHINVRIAREWGFDEVRRAALAVAREVEHLAPGRATTRWWKEERQGVFLDYNQNAKDRTVASAYSARPVADAKVSAPLTWDEVPDCVPEELTVRTMPARYAEVGDLHAGMDGEVGRLDALLELAARQEADGAADAPWPPYYGKREGEPPRGKRRPKVPTVIVAESEDLAAARAGLERWKARHPEVVPHLEPRHVLTDKMRGRYTTWTRIRVNLEAVPADLRPEQGQPDPDDAPNWGAPEG